MGMTIEEWKNYYNNMLINKKATHEDLKAIYEEHNNHKSVWSYKVDKESFQNAQRALEEILNIPAPPDVFNILDDLNNYLHSRRSEFER